MTKANAIQILSDRFGTYSGSFVATPSGNLIEDIMMEGDEGKTFHRFASTIVEEKHLIGLAKHYA